MSIFNFVASLFGSGRKRSGRPLSVPAELMGRELRTRALTTPASEIGIAPSPEFPRVFGVLMDFHVGGGQVASVLAYCDGNASLYTTSTFGIIGGIGHESVRRAARAFVQTAEKHCDEAVATRELFYPPDKRVRFYLLCYDGVRMIEADMDALLGGTDGRRDLWTQGQRVLTELRLITEKSNEGADRK